MTLSHLTNWFKPAPARMVAVTGGDRRFEVRRGETLLEGARRAGIALPYDCTVGTCATCRVRLVEGHVRPILDFAYTLSAAELESGYILACQSRLRSDVTIELPDEGVRPTFPCATYAATIAGIDHLATDVIGLRLELDRPIDYAAGQYADLSTHAVGGARSYSFASACPPGGTRVVEFHVRVLPDGAFSGWLGTRAKAGDPLTLGGPAGAFTLRDGNRPIVCVAGGTGLAPILAVLEQAASRGVPRAVTLLCGARNEAGLYAHDRIEALRAAWPTSFRYLPVLSDSTASSWTGARGLVTEHLTSTESEIPLADAYLCGPPAMIDAGVERLVAAGLDLKHIFYDKFLDSSQYGPAITPVNAAAEGAAT